MLDQGLYPFLPIAALAEIIFSEDLDAFCDFFSNTAETEVRSRDIGITALDFYDSWAERKNELPLLTTPSIRACDFCSTHSHAPPRAGLSLPLEWCSQPPLAEPESECRSLSFHVEKLFRIDPNRPFFRS